MLNFLAKRLLGLLPTLLIVAVLVFLFVHMLPGDPARLAAGAEADEATVALVRADLGLDKPLPQQFVNFFAKVVHFDFGMSTRSKRPVSAPRSPSASCRRCGSRSRAWSGRWCSAWRSASCRRCGATSGRTGSA